MGLRVSSITIGDEKYPLVFNNSTFQWMEENNIDLSKLREGSAMSNITTILKIVWRCIQAGVRYTQMTSDPDYASVEPISYEDFLELTSPDDYNEFLVAISECMGGARNVAASLKKTGEPKAKVRKN